MKNQPRVRVSDHALVRFLERAGGHEVEAVREALGESLARASIAAEKINTADFDVIADGLRYVVRGGTLVTISPSRPGRRSKAVA